MKGRGSPMRPRRRVTRGRCCGGLGIGLATTGLRQAKCVEYAECIDRLVGRRRPWRSPLLRGLLERAITGEQGHEGQGHALPREPESRAASYNLARVAIHASSSRFPSSNADVNPWPKTLPSHIRPSSPRSRPGRDMLPRPRSQHPRRSSPGLASSPPVSIAMSSRLS